MHLNFDNTVTAACLTSSALYIKTESSFLISFCLGICCCCKKISDLVKYPGISRRIGTWSTANRWLVNIDNLIQLVCSQNILMFSRNHSCPVQISCQAFIKNLIDQRALTWARNSCDTGHDPKRYLHIDILEIILCRPLDSKKTGWLPSLQRYRDF